MKDKLRRSEEEGMSGQKKEEEIMRKHDRPMKQKKQRKLEEDRT
jgi:hypothetical protein